MSQSTPHILILCKTKLHSDPRVLKQIAALGDQHVITCVGVEKSNQLNVDYDLGLFESEVASVSSRIKHLVNLMTKRYSSIYWTLNHKRVYRSLREKKYDLIICNETESLPIADRLAIEQNIPIYCDLHEFYLVDKKNGRSSKSQLDFEKWLLLNHKQRVSHFTTVSPQIIELYKNEYNVDCTLLTNACKKYDLVPQPISANQIKLVCHGGAIRNRKIETMIYATDMLSDVYTLDLFLAENNSEYLNDLREIVKTLRHSRITIRPAIPFDKIQETINKYDVGIYSLFPTHLNNQYALPNKLFEFIQGRLAVAIGPTPAMADIVREYDIGTVANDFTVESLAKSISKLSIEDISRYKQNTNRAAEELNSENNIKEIRRIVTELLTKTQ